MMDHRLVDRADPVQVGGRRLEEVAVGMIVYLAGKKTHETLQHHVLAEEAGLFAWLGAQAQGLK